MRVFFALLTGVLLTQSAVVKADNYEADFDDSEYAASADFADAGWNRWTCTATRPFNLRIYRGTSYYFRDGSGEGQEAKRIAQKIALRACEFASNTTCNSNLANCTVENH